MEFIGSFGFVELARLQVVAGYLGHTNTREKFIEGCSFLHFMHSDFVDI